ncbi:MAG: heparinase II/III family protein, partial [Acidobacteriota bacterium]|nr:heparinase II/III family protein [Acidobacteriota bacterium]
MKPVELLRRAAGKSPRYLIRRSLEELRRRSGARRLRQRLQTMTPGTLARECGVESLGELWGAVPACAFRLPPQDRDALRALYAGPYAAERERLRGRVEKILAHEFDLLGSGPTVLGDEIDWNRDFKSGCRWDLAPSDGIDYAELDRPSDVKVPWELSRGQHFTDLARAWVIEGDARCPAEFEREVRSWIRQNPVGLGVNWACTMDVGLRAVSWIWALGLFEEAPFSGTFRDEILFSLYQHGLWIPEHLEIGEVNGNHFLSDALGLVACGTVFQKTPSGRKWLELGAQFFEREMREQVTADGVDIEGSVPYHRLVLEILVVAARFLEIAGSPPSAAFRARLEAMLDFVHAYVTPEGLSPVVGDADDGRALILGETAIRDHRYLLSTGCAWLGRGRWKSRAARFWEDSLWLLGPAALARFESLEATGEPEVSRAFPDAGFFVLRSPKHYLFVDAGPVGFRGRGGHGHNDCLSFEWHSDRPLLTDSGAYVYTPAPEWRNRFRSTEFHNTVRVDGQEINRFPSAVSLWSLRNDARPIDVRLVRGDAQDVLEGAHTGYQRLADPVTVRREFEFHRAESFLRIRDRVEGAAEHLVEFFFHGAPEA